MAPGRRRYCGRQIAVPCAAIAPLAEFWFLTRHAHIVLVPGSAIWPCANCGTAVLLAHTPLTIFVLAGHVAVHDELAPAPELDVPVHVT